MSKVYVDDQAICLECQCGAVFEPEKIIVDKYGERWAVCPKCKNQLQLGAKD